MISRVIDVTDQFNASNAYIQDLSGWDYAVVQLVSPSGAVSFTSTNDDGSVTGQLNPVPVAPANFLTVFGLNITTNTAVTSANASALVKFNVIGRFLRLAGSGVTATKVIISLNKVAP